MSDARGKMHCVVGGGNLGMDVACYLAKQKITKRVFTKRYGYDYPRSLDQIIEARPEVIWVTAGGGSIGGDFLSQLDLHVRLVVDLHRSPALKDTKIVAFSTDYIADEAQPQDPNSTGYPKSHYAMSKKWLEDYVKREQDPRIRVIRVGSLYGDWKPGQCFPVKLRKNFPNPQHLVLPSNLVTPTPTIWVAETLIDGWEVLYADGVGCIQHLAPLGNTSVANWGSKILGPQYEVAAGDLDSQRPLVSNLGTSLVFAKEIPTWEDLWKKHASPEILGLAPPSRPI